MCIRDSYCMKQKAVDEHGGSIICLPNKVVIEGENTAEDLDSESSPKIDAVSYTHLCNLCVAACVFYSCRLCCSCFYSCCLSFVDRYGSLCEFNCRSFYCYLAGCCGISDLCCDNCCSGFYAFNNTLAAYCCNPVSYTHLDVYKRQ